MLCGFVSIDVSMLLFLGFMVLDLWFGEVWDQILDESSEIVTNFFFSEEFLDDWYVEFDMISRNICPKSVQGSKLLCCTDHCDFFFW